eukprot:480102-Pleurochrysis_carterae.AAC.1
MYARQAQCALRDNTRSHRITKTSVHLRTKRVEAQAKTTKQASKKPTRQTSKVTRASQNRDRKSDKCKTFCCRDSEESVSKWQAPGGHAVRLINEPLSTQAR